MSDKYLSSINSITCSTPNAISLYDYCLLLKEYNELVEETISDFVSKAITNFTFNKFKIEGIEMDPFTFVTKIKVEGFNSYYDKPIVLFRDLKSGVVLSYSKKIKDEEEIYIDNNTMQKLVYFCEENSDYFRCKNKHKITRQLSCVTLDYIKENSEVELAYYQYPGYPEGLELKVSICEYTVCKSLIFDGFIDKSKGNKKIEYASNIMIDTHKLPQYIQKYILSKPFYGKKKTL